PVPFFEGDITLNCLFPSQPGMNLQRLTLTWQKEQAGAEALVLHSYYYGKEQLERQDQIYRNRTQLDPEGLARGNASLTLRGIRIQDEGIYLCHITSEQGKISWPNYLPLLCVPAPYSEVRLEVSVSSQVTLTCRAEGGYPEASVLWLDGARNNVTAESDTSLQRDLRKFTACSSHVPGRFPGPGSAAEMLRVRHLLWQWPHALRLGVAGLFCPVSALPVRVTIPLHIHPARSLGCGHLPVLGPLPRVPLALPSCSPQPALDSSSPSSSSTVPQCCCCCCCSASSLAC
uniref:Ig-like domain-containing protein n=1 Tax=Gopherus agassizii TaxID=38772 RepID=A0A452HYU1_9SAUR